VSLKISHNRGLVRVNIQDIQVKALAILYMFELFFLEIPICLNYRYTFFLTTYQLFSIPVCEMRASCLLLVLVSLLVCISVKAFETDAFDAGSHAPILMEIESSLEELSQAIARGEVDASTLDEEQFELDEEFDTEVDVEQAASKCPTVTCKPGYYATKRPGYTPSKNGCGADGTSWLSTTVNRVRISFIHCVLSFIFIP